MTDVVHGFHCTRCNKQPAYFHSMGGVPWCDDCWELRVQKRDREFLESVVAHPVARTKEEIKAAFIAHRREQMELDEGDLIAQVDDDEAWG